MIESKNIQIELKGILLQRYELIETELGIEDDKKLLNFLIEELFIQKLAPSAKQAKTEVEQDKKRIMKFMEKNGEEWQKLGE
ncbi:MAG: hypothetical protein JXA54_06955 [Candidatus Heimdallarchaeota archaeon]|nr:hypothetical protein [Candidatus Heimdallarchaeota archaeon]